MSTYVPKEVQAGLDSARLAGLKKASRLRLKTDGETYPVLRMWKTGFAIMAENAPHLRGYVDLYDGAIHLFQCLIVAQEDEVEGGELHFEFKRLTAVSENPALDFVRAADAPVGLIENNR